MSDTLAFPGGNSLLHDACGRGQLNVVKALLDDGADINYRDFAGLSPLHYAVDLTILCRCFNKYGADSRKVLNFIIDISTSMTTMLIDRGALVNLVDKEGRTPIHIAAFEKNNKALSVMLENNAHVNVGDSNGLTALHCCAKVGNFEGAKLLLNKEADVNACNLFGDTAFHMACDQGHLEVSRLLLQNGAIIDARNKWLVTPFLLASCQKDISIIKFLLDNGADANAVDNTGQTALHRAVETENHDVLSYILNCSVDPDVNCRDRNGETALHIAVMFNNNCNVVKLLLRHGSDIDCLDNNEETPMHNVIIQLYDSEYPDLDFNIYYSGRLRNINTLLDYHADLTLPTRYRSAFDIILTCDLFPPVKKAMLEYICKIKVANLPVGKRYSDELLSKVDTSYYQLCEKEVKLMKETKVDNVSFYQILAVPLMKLVFYLRNQKIEDCLFNKRYKEYTAYSSLIEARFDLALHRDKLLKASTPLLIKILSVKPSLPYDCVEHILSFLSNKDLQFLSNLR